MVLLLQALNLTHLILVTFFFSSLVGCFFFIEVFCFSNWDLKFFASVGPAWIFISFLV